MTTLIEAVESGQGIERPFRCTEHEDHMASASVNVVKGVWFCHACHASGAIDKKKAPKVAELQQMMEPEKIPRIYDPLFLELYNQPGDYWLSRFSEWAAWFTGLGEDPFTGDAIFPVHTGNGLLAGVGRRHVNPEDGVSRYLYPKGWSAASSLFGMGGQYHQVDVLTVVEGAADATACWEVGMPALATYGSGFHLPQFELVARCNPKLLLYGFDMDDAGRRATNCAEASLQGRYITARIDWRPGGDPAEATPKQRVSAILEAVASAGDTRDADEACYRMEDLVRAIRHDYKESMEDR